MSKDPQSNYYDAGGIETLDIIKAKLTPEQYSGYLLGNALKYHCRAMHKNPVSPARDAEKAANYSRWFLEHCDKKPGFSVLKTDAEAAARASRRQALYDQFQMSMKKIIASRTSEFISPELGQRYTWYSITDQPNALEQFIMAHGHDFGLCTLQELLREIYKIKAPANEPEKPAGE